MPKEGYNTITVRNEVYDKWHKIYKSKKAELEEKGVNSFSGFIEYKLFELLDEREKLRKFASKIRIVPKEFTETVLRIKPMELLT